MDDCCTIPLTGGGEAIVDVADYDFINQWKWKINKDGYAWRKGRCDGRYVKVFMHKVIFPAPPGMQTDHINNNRLDNRRRNLRHATIWENAANRSLGASNTSGFKGVTRTKDGKWVAQLVHKGKNNYLGRYGSPVEAAKAFNAAALRLHGEFAWLNPYSRVRRVEEMLRVYVAAPYTQGNPEENTKRAIAAGDELLRHGLAPYVPHLSHFWHGLHPHDYETWMRLDFAWLEQCDVLVRLPGDSPGADREVAFARAHNIPVYYGISELLLAVIGP